MRALTEDLRPEHVRASQQRRMDPDASQIPGDVVHGRCLQIVDQSLSFQTPGVLVNLFL